MTHVIVAIAWYAVMLLFSAAILWFLMKGKT